MLKKSVKRIFLLALLFLGIFSFVLAQSSWDSEKLALEIRMQKQVETAISKILPAGQFVVVVRVEPLNKPPSSNTDSITNEEFFLPGVPIRKKNDGTAEAVKGLVETLKPGQEVFMRFVRRISATLVLDQNIPENTVESVRELTRQILGLNAERGDTLDIQRTFFNLGDAPGELSTISKFQKNLKDYWILISLTLILFCISVFLLFVFGPLRGFLNRFVQVLPTLKADTPQPQSPQRRFSPLEAQMLPAMLQSLLPNQGGGGMGGNGNFSGSLMVENPNKRTTPFGFIREDHLGNLATLLSRETPEKAAVVLGYLPPEWISRVLSKIEPAMQPEITEHLATTRQLLPEQVEDIEQDLKRRLDYLIGGPDRIRAVYESLDPESQRSMLDNLKETAPDLAEELRSRTFLFEDIERLDPASFKLLLRELDLETLIACLRGTSSEFRQKVFENLSTGKAEIVQEELEFADGPAGKASIEAQHKVALLARRMEREGRITFPNQETKAPPTRYGGGGKSNLKISTDFSVDESELVDGEVVDDLEQTGNIESKIKEFMNRQPAKKERFPLGGEAGSSEKDES